MITILKKIYKLIMSRGFIISFLLLIQLFIIVYLSWKLGQFGIYVYAAFNIMSIIVSFAILNRSFNPAYKISWMLLVLTVPFAGVFFYLMFGNLRLSKNRQNKLNYLKQQISKEVIKNSHNISIDDQDINKVSKYITNITGMMPMDNTISQLLPSGEDFHKSLLEELEKAEKFIFLEYFIIREGEMWDSIEKILIEKAKKGVDVRVIYDDFACINKVKFSFKGKLIKNGIKVINFNPYRPRLTMVINYRDHRKITVIDGNVGYVGGINIGDEYINRVQKFGYWKDASLILKGDGVWNLTLLFLQMWQFSSNDQLNYDLYRPTVSYTTTGFVQPFGDGPLDSHQTIEMSYIQLINSAKKYVYITTPYLVLDNEMATSLKLAAMGGVDVRIMMPHIPDKKIVFMISQSHYLDLINAGVKIYEFRPGFLHSKYIVADDKTAIIGTANLDYRSFYLHYEVGCLLYQTTSINDIKKDFDRALEVSHQVTLEEAKKISWIKKIFVSFLRAFSPMI